MVQTTTEIIDSLKEADGKVKQDIFVLILQQLQQINENTKRV